MHGEGLTSIPLSEAGPPAEGPRFERLDAQRTGIDFVHRWDPPPEHAHRLNTSATVGGVAIGDYDDDGFPDVALTSPQGGSRLYRGKGDFRFEDVTEPAGIDAGTWGAGVSFADIDNDGDLDLYLCVFNGANRLYRNRGDGTFSEEAAARGLAYRGASTMMAFADYDNDGDLDGYLLTNNDAPSKVPPLRAVMVDGVPTVPERYQELWALIEKPDGRYVKVPAAQLDHLYRNDGDGTFTDVSREAGIRGNHFGLSVTWWDYNDDGFPDIYVANDFFGPDQLYRNNRDGTFTDVAARALPHTPWFSMGSDAADINNDGRVDFMSSDMAFTTHYKRKLSTGEMDKLTWFYEVATPPQYMRNSVYVNTGTGRFLEIAYLSGLARTNWTWSIKLSDLDSDGWVDLFVTNGMTRDWFNSDLYQKANAAGHKVSISPYYLDSPPLAEANLAFKNLGDLRFEDVSRSWGLDYVGVSFGSALGDLDQDGDLDLVVNNFQEPAGVYRNRSTGGHRVKIRLRGSSSNRWGIGAKVSLRTAAGMQVRHLTLSRGIMSADDPLVHFGLGDQERIASLAVRWPGGWEQRFEDIEADRFYTVVEPDHASPEADPGPGPSRFFERSDALAGVRHVESSFDDYARQPLQPAMLSRLGPGMAWGDIDGDGDDDLYVGGASGQWKRLYINLGHGGFQPGSNHLFGRDASREDMAPLFFDADGDGDLDLYVVSGSVECEPGAELLRDRLYLNDGSGRFDHAPGNSLPDLRDSGGPVAAADPDRDGDLDLFVGGRVVPGAYPVTPDSRLLVNDGGGRFRDATDRMAPGLRRTGLVTSALWTDVDDDGWIDLLVTHEWGPVKLWRNDRGRLVDATVDAGLGEWVGWWNGIASADVDNDGDMDYAVTNLGLNTKYHASAERPATLYYGDFDGTGEMRIVEAEFEDDELVPVRGLSCSTEAIPSLATRVRSFEQFALNDLDDLYSTRLDSALRLEATTFETGVLVNDGQGRFTFRALPLLAQVSPGYGVVFDDVDQDGNADLYIAQNFFSPQSETGRFDGGVSLLLTGNGDGTFDPVWPSRSGLVVPGDAKGLARADIDGDGRGDFVVTVNDGEMMAFENRHPAAGRTARIRLTGRRGNPTAVGSRVVVHLLDGTIRSAEVRAGGSYLSQSSSILAVGLGPEGGVREIEVRWPDGRKSSHRPPRPHGSITIEQPG